MDATSISQSKVKYLIQIAVQKHQSDDNDEAESINKTEVAEILKLAVYQQQDNRLLEAELLYSQVLEKQPDNFEALYGLGMLAQQMGQPQTAEQWLNAASQVQPNSVKTWFSLGNLHLVQEQFPEAEKAYRQALVLLPNSLPIYNNLGYTLQQQGLFEEAVNYYQKALELKPDFIEAEANLGNALHAQGKLSSNQKIYYAQLNNQLGVARKKALDLKNAVTCYKRAIALQPNFLEAHYNLALALQEQGKLEEAIASYQKLLELNPSVRLLEAEKLYSQVLEKQPDNPEALYGLGMLAQQMGQLQTAEQWLSAASQVQPDSVKTWFSLGNLYLVQEQFPEAEKAYRQALVLLPNSLPIYNNLGYTLQQQGLFEEAVNYYQKALRLKPDFIEAEANLGNALHAQGKLSSNQQIYYAQLNNQLGVARKKAFDLKNAVTCYKQAIALQPNFLEAHYNLALALQEQGKLKEAIASYQKLLELNPKHGEAHLNLGKIYQQLNQDQKAVFAYRQGLKLINPHYAKALATDEDAKIPQQAPVTPSILQKEVIVGQYSFPTIPTVANDISKRPFWSVVITVYNRTDYLLECLVSVLAQWQGEQMEIIVMDDASTTPVFELVNSIGQGIINYYRNPQNLGLPGNWNAGVALTRGHWVHLLHDDDYILPGFYSRLQESLEGCSDSVGAAFTGYENINEKGEVIFSQQVYGDQQGIAQNWLQIIGISNSLNMPAVVIRREAHEQLGVYHPELTYTSDWEVYKRIASVYDWWYEPQILARYRQHANNVTSELLLSGKQMISIRRAIEISKSYFPTEYSAQITAQSRSHYFLYCLESLIIPLQAGNMAGVWQGLEEALKIDRSPEAVEKLFRWLTQEEAAPLREEIASRFISLPL
ncbi:tetratricopeptide repeat protein [Nostoc sp.]|uniref:tetratricopeptide repeat protein n=1 Tax=Nostoc sp. TaxID=1180 RepID=UPI002FF715CE